MNAPLPPITGSMAPCRKCGGTKAIVTTGKGPHAAGLHCAACGRFIRWLSHGHVELLTREAQHDA